MSHVRDTLQAIQVRGESVSKGFGEHFESDDGVNPAGNESVHNIDLSRRHVFKCTAGAVAMLLGASAFATGTGIAKALGFTSVPVSFGDHIKVPQEYDYSVLYRWGDPVGAIQGSPVFKTDASNTWEEQALQAGMHHDGMAFFPIDGNPRHGLLAINHEYTDDGLLHADGMVSWSADKVRKSQAAHGVSVVEVLERQGEWRVMPQSRFARRITAFTPMNVSGPARGHTLLKTTADPKGEQILGTLNNCASGATPWGTYLTCEENWNGYFSSQEKPNADEQRYGLRHGGWGYRWHEHDTRFDSKLNPNEPHRFGWVVEIDPTNPNHVPVKRTALGRIKHEGATVTRSQDGRAVVYMGDDERFEYIYKFVSRDKIKTGGAAANATLLDHGILYVARFNAEGQGQWLPLVHGQNGLTVENGFADQGEVCIKARQAADRLGATKMDRPEWIAIHPHSGEVFATLTNNNQRGQPGREVDAANPRADNIMGHIIRWRESGDAAATEFRWSQFALAGDPNASSARHQGTIKGDMYGSPDGLAFDASGLLWIQTDVSTSTLNKGPYQNIGNNMMLCANQETGETKRFLTGPMGCEITGIAFTPDRRAMFINIQHPGETASERSDPNKPQAVSQWPDGPQGGRPRSATVVIRRKDGGIVGT
jgi:secreted PhoX family phosphatase